MASQPVSSTTICNYNFDSYITGYHAYKDRWNQPWIGEVLPLERDPTNPHDKFAVAVKKRGETVGHLPFNVAPVVSAFFPPVKCLCVVIMSSKMVFMRFIKKPLS